MFQRTDDLIAQIRSINGSLPKRIRIWTADVKEFFMTGKHSDLITRSFRHIENVSLRQALENLLEVILYHQYVASPLLPNELKVISGSGMGNRHSGEVSDVAYLDGV